jgi:hypothetical protein
MKLCPKCQKEHHKDGVYCSRSCANSRVWSETDKLKNHCLQKNLLVVRTMYQFLGKVENFLREHPNILKNFRLLYVSVLIELADKL